MGFPLRAFLDPDAWPRWIFEARVLTPMFVCTGSLKEELPSWERVMCQNRWKERQGEEEGQERARNSFCKRRGGHGGRQDLDERKCVLSLLTSMVCVVDDDLLVWLRCDQKLQKPRFCLVSKSFGPTTCEVEGLSTHSIYPLHVILPCQSNIILCIL
jgi:hypothetical protein